MPLGGREIARHLLEIGMLIAEENCHEVLVPRLHPDRVEVIADWRVQG
jgi:hypothetical protein